MGSRRRETGFARQGGARIRAIPRQALELSSPESPYFLIDAEQPGMARWGSRPCHPCRCGEKVVLPEGIELSTSPLPRECSTTELRQHAAPRPKPGNPGVTRQSRRRLGSRPSPGCAQHAAARGVGEATDTPAFRRVGGKHPTISPGCAPQWGKTWAPGTGLAEAPVRVRSLTPHRGCGNKGATSSLRAGRDVTQAGSRQR